MIKGVLLVGALSFCFCSVAQKEHGNVNDVSTILFRDTVEQLAFDSATTRLYGMEKGTFRLVKYFKYVGDTPVVITKAWTGDPHYICNYPNEPLMPGEIYSFKTCFSFYPGLFHKLMGFELSNGKRITLIYKGSVLPSP